jgi:hypothetical protein
VLPANFFHVRVKWEEKARSAGKGAEAPYTPLNRRAAYGEPARTKEGIGNSAARKHAIRTPEKPSEKRKLGAGFCSAEKAEERPPGMEPKPIQHPKLGPNERASVGWKKARDAGHGCVGAVEFTKGLVHEHLSQSAERASERFAASALSWPEANVFYKEHRTRPGERDFPSRRGSERPAEEQNRSGKMPREARHERGKGLMGV